MHVKVTRPSNQFGQKLKLDLSLFSTLMVRPQSSAAGVLALLQEPDDIFKQHALRALIPLVSQFWAEISEHIAAMYAFIVMFSSDLCLYVVN